MNKRIAIYARVSTSDQDPEMQLVDLRKHAQARGWEIFAEYVDRGASGVREDRAEYQRMLADVRRRKVDLVLVWRFDRFSRSIRQLVTALDEFDSLGVDFASYNEAFDTTTPSGRLLFAVVGAMAEFERNIILERVRAGIAKARANGKHLGHPPVAEEKIASARRALGAGASIRRAAQESGLSVGRTWKVAQSMKIRAT
jgi:DNA invertase Pin-like site-specific DNA recombinase